MFLVSGKRKEGREGGTGGGRKEKKRKEKKRKEKKRKEQKREKKRKEKRNPTLIFHSLTTWSPTSQSPVLVGASPWGRLRSRTELATGKQFLKVTVEAQDLTQWALYCSCQGN